MHRIFAVLVIMGLVLSGCATTGTDHVKVYKFEKERVDQSVSGNQGYIMGEPVAAATERKAKRTMIGVDIDLPSELFPPFGKDLYEEEEMGTEASVREIPKSGKTSGCAVPKSGKPEKSVEPEEDWVK